MRAIAVLPDLIGFIHFVLLNSRASKGLSVETYPLVGMEPPAASAFAEQASPEEFEAAMAELAKRLDDVPVPAPEALTREAIYGRRG